MNSSDFKKLTALRLKEAKLLLNNKCYAGSYYLGGYVVECALKSCIAAKTQAGEFPPKPNVVQEYYKHDLAGLVRLAGLQIELEKRCLSKEFDSNWKVVKGWTEQVRYESNIDKQRARDLMIALTDSKHGVIRWLKMYW